MRNLQDVHPYTTKRMHAFKSTRMKYIKALHATSLQSVVFNAVNAPSFCRKPQSLGSLLQRFWFPTKTRKPRPALLRLLQSMLPMSSSLTAYVDHPLCVVSFHEDASNFVVFIQVFVMELFRLFRFIFTISLRIPEFSQLFQPQLPLGHHMREYDVLLSDHQNPAWNSHFCWGLGEISDSDIMLLVCWKALLEDDVDLLWLCWSIV